MVLPWLQFFSVLSRTVVHALDSVRAPQPILAIAFALALLAAAAPHLPASAADPVAPIRPAGARIAQSLEPSSPPERVSVSAGISGGVGVLVFDWPRPVVFSAEIAQGRLTLRFARPFEAGFAPAVAALGQFLSAGGLYPDRRTAQFALKRRDLALRTSRDGARVVVELFPLSPDRPGPGEPGRSDAKPATSRQPAVESKPPPQAAAQPQAEPPAKPEPPAAVVRGRKPEAVPGTAPGMAPAMVPGTAPGMVPGTAPAMAPGTAPGTVAAIAPSAPGSRPDSRVDLGRARLADGRPDLALAAVAGEPGEPAERLRLDAHWRRGDWRAASASALKLLEKLPLSGPGAARPALSAADRRLALDAAVAATLARDRAALESLNARFAAAMQAGAYRDPFNLLASIAPQDDPRESARRAIEAAEGLQRFLAQRPLAGLAQVTP